MHRWHTEEKITEVLQQLWLNEYHIYYPSACTIKKRVCFIPWIMVNG